MGLRTGISISSGIGIGSGGGALSAGGQSPLTIVSAAKMWAYYRADFGITIDNTDHANGVSAWNDQSANARHVVQATGAKMPTWSATSGPNSQAGVTFALANSQTLANVLAQLPTPGAGTPLLYWFIFKFTTWGANDTFLSSGRAAAFEGGVFCNVATPQIAQGCTTVANSNGNLALNTFARGQVLFNGGTTDYVKLGPAAAVTGVSAGVSAPDAGFWMGSRADAATTHLSGVLCEILVATDLLTAEAPLLDAYATSRYGAGLV